MKDKIVEKNADDLLGVYIFISSRGIGVGGYLKKDKKGFYIEDLGERIDLEDGIEVFLTTLRM